ncbi:hypothetical protein LJC20_03625 [Eubacteriales bacterium OttesenSCG-928-M02]|nr:hypothetical protein [Eubacteriales bacterium OttesenSCG-928-M02]
MKVSSVDQSYLLHLYEALANRTNSTTTEGNADNKAITVMDTATLASDVKRMPPPPHEKDFEGISDEELKDYLSQMYAVTGMLPGGVTGNVEALSEEELSQFREILTEMAKHNPAAQLFSNQDTSTLAGDDFKLMLTLFLLGNQDSLFSQNTDSTSNSLFYGDNTQTIIQTILDNLLAKLEGAEDTGETEDPMQKAIEAYEKNMTIL